MQPPPPSGTAPAMDASSTISNNGNPVNTVLSGVSCSRTSAAEAAGYSWMPHVRCFALLLYELNIFDIYFYSLEVLDGI